jgi:hypothetical protein
MPLTMHISAMTQKTADRLETSKELSSPPPSYKDSSPAVHFPDYVLQQSGGGRRHQSPPVELTPTRLRSTLKVTSRDVGVVKDASMRRQVYQFPSPPAQGPAPFHFKTSSSAVDDFATSSDASSLTLPAPNSRHTSPFAGDNTSRRLGPAPLNDIFYDSMGAQPEWMDPTGSNAFDLIGGDSFTSALLSQQMSGVNMDGATRPSPWAMSPAHRGHVPETSNLPSSDNLLVHDMSHHLAHPLLHRATSLQPPDFTAATPGQRFASQDMLQEPPRRMDFTTSLQPPDFTVATSGQRLPS